MLPTCNAWRVIPLAEREPLRRRRCLVRRRAAACARRVLRLDHATLNHLLWGDRIWMSRLAGTAATAGRHSAVGVALCRLERPQARTRGVRHRDRRLGRPARGTLRSPASSPWFSGAIKAEVRKPKWLLVTHMFQSPDPSPRSGALHADADRQQARRYRLASHAGVTSTAQPS